MGSADGWHDASGLPASNTQLNEIAGAIGGARTRLPLAEWDHHYRDGYQAWVEDELVHALGAMTAASPHGAGP